MTFAVRMIPVCAMPISAGGGPVWPDQNLACAVGEGCVMLKIINMPLSNGMPIHDSDLGVTSTTMPCQQVVSVHGQTSTY